jgi:pantoate--beta-alanine ligase
MEIVREIQQVRKAVGIARSGGRKIGFVPTLGALHEGHLSLVRAARAETGFVVVSIFVNPTQFGPNEDFTRYPRRLGADAKMCEGVGADLIFAPEAKKVYAEGFVTYVVQERLTEVLCGPHRPGHFRGVTTVVAKLLNIVQPDTVYFGQKDYQQAVVIRRMVRDLDMPVEVRVMPTVREPDGLAMSSRNTYLTPAQRGRALCVFRALSEAKRRVESGERSASVLLDAMNAIVRPAVDKVDYISVVHPDTLVEVDTVSQGAVAALAVWIGKTRLIDSIVLSAV